MALAASHQVCQAASLGAAELREYMSCFTILLHFSLPSSVLNSAMALALLPRCAKQSTLADSIAPPQRHASSAATATALNCPQSLLAVPCSLAVARRRRVELHSCSPSPQSMDVDPTQEDEASALPKARGLGAGAALWHDEASNTQKIYVDRQFFASYEDQVQALTDSKTVYIGNLSFYTTEAQIVELCSRTGPVKKVIMGLNRHTKEPCGFCFVEHYSSEAALDTVSRITGLVLDDRPLRAELDFGFRDGRQFASVFIFHIIDRRGRTLFTELLHTLTPCDETTKTKLPWHRGDPPHARSFRVRVRGPSLYSRRYGRGQSGGQVRDDRRVTYDPARDARRGADVVDAPAPAPAAVPEEEPAAETVSGAKKRLRDDDDDESEDD